MLDLFVALPPTFAVKVKLFKTMCRQCKLLHPDCVVHSAFTTAWLFLFDVADRCVRLASFKLGTRGKVGRSVRVTTQQSELPFPLTPSWRVQLPLYRTLHCQYCTVMILWCICARNLGNLAKRVQIWNGFKVVYAAVEITNPMHKFAPLLYSYVLAPTCFGSSLPSSGSFLDPSELRENTDRLSGLYKIYNK
jgi:hypothetical protein